MPTNIRTSPPKPGKTNEIGDSWGIGKAGISVNPDYNTKMTGIGAIKTYDQMRMSDATVRASLLAVKQPILSARWYIESASESRADQKVADFIETELFDKGTRTWQETLQEILLYLDYGRMPFEIVFEFRVDGMIGLRKLSPRKPDTIYAWKLLNGDPGILQQTVNGRFEIPMDKLIVFVHQKEGENWEGVSILRSAWMHYDLKRALYRFQNIGAERQSVGVPIATKPSGALDADVDKMEEMLGNLRTNEKAFLIKPTGWEVVMMDMKAGSTKNLDSYIQHHDRAILLNVLAQFLSLGSTSVGSFALSNDQSRLFIMCLEEKANYIADNINRYLIPKLVDYNFEVDAYPKIKYDKIGSIDQNIFTTSLQRLQQTGLFTPTSADEEYIRDVMDLPANDGKSDVDLTMFDSMLTELDASMAGLSGDATQGATEDPNNPGFDMNGQPMPVETPTASSTDAEWLRAAESVHFVFKGGPAGVPLSEETKRKISEALSKGKGKGKGSKSKTNPQDTADRKQIAGIQKQVRDLNNESRRKLLELKAKGEKLSPEDSAKMQLDVFDKKNKLQAQIDVLKNGIASRKVAPAPAKASDSGPTLDRINDILDGYEKK